MEINKNNLIKIALIGCGRISKNHLKSIMLYPELCQLTALCDCNLKKIDEAQLLIDDYIKDNPSNYEKIYKYRFEKELFEDIKNKKIDIDLVVLATPSGFHSKQVIAAANAGVDVCTEKPMATKWEDGLKMLEACKRNKVKLFVVKQNRFNKTIDLVRQQILNGRFGKIGLVTVNVFWQRPQSYYDQDDWRGTLELDGGALMNQASHYVDLLEWMIGPVESINASIATIARNIEAEDTAAIKIKWKNGAIGTMSVTMIAYPHNLEGSITVLGEKGSVKIGGKAVNKIELWEFEDPHEDDELVSNASYETTNVYGFGHPIYYENMLKSIKGECEPICTGDEGLKSLQLLIAAYQSAKLEKDIKLPLPNKN